MFVFHFDVNRAEFLAVEFKAADFLENHIPAGLRDGAARNISKNILVEVAYAVIVRLVALTKNFAAKNFFPREAVNIFVEQKFLSG